MKTKCINIYSKFDFIDIFILIYIFLMLANFMFDSYLYLMLGLSLFLVAFILIGTQFSFKLRPKYILVLFFLIWILINGIPVAGTTYSLKRTGEALIEFSPILIFDYYCFYKKPSVKKYKILISTILTFVGILCFISLYSYLILGVNARHLAQNKDLYGNIPTGGYTFAYAITVLSVYLLDRIKNKVICGRKSILLCLLLISLSFITVIFTFSTITIVSFAIGVMLVLITPSINNNLDSFTRALKFTKSLLIAIVFFAVVYLFSALIIELGRSVGGIVGERIEDFGFFMSGDFSKGNYSEYRMSIPLNSFYTFINNPLIGVSYLHGNGFYRPYLFGAGNHCDWVDALTNYGIIGGIPLLIIYFSPIVKLYRKKNDYITIGVIITFVLLGLFNPFRSLQTGVVVFFVIPFINKGFLTARTNRYEDFSYTIILSEQA